MKKKDSRLEIEITAYTDYAEYISDLMNIKRENSGFSFRIFCRKSGFKSPSYLKWVIEGTRSISLKSIHKFVEGLSLSKREAQYFSLMVNYKEAKDAQTKCFYYEQMLSWQQKSVGTFTKDAYEYLSHWYYVAIRELVGADDYEDDPHWIRERLDASLSLWDIKNGLEILERLGLIQRDLYGRREQSTKNLYTENEVTSLAAFSYHAEMLELAREALSRRGVDEREYQSLVALIDRDTYLGLKEKIQGFQKEMIEYIVLMEKKRIENKSETEQDLYALNTQLLPLTVRKEGKK